MRPYSVDFMITRAGPAIRDRYQRVGRIPGDDAGYCDWPGRVQYDIDDGLDPEVSLAKHLRELEQALGLGPTPLPPGPRAPLPPFPPQTPGHEYDAALPTGFPLANDPLCYRGNFCGIRVPGAPGVPGGVNFTVPGGDTSLMMAAHLDRYPLEWQQAYLARYASYGYTHVQQSLGHSVEAGRTIDQFVETQQLIQSFALYPDIWFLGGPGFADRDRDAAYWAPRLAPWIDALLTNRAISTACVGWQLDGYNKESDARTGEGPLQSIIDWIAEQVGPHEIPLGAHWLNEAGSWNVDPTTGRTDRFAWWKRQRNKLLWFHHQGNVNLEIGGPFGYQAKLVDTLRRFGDGSMGTSGLFGDRPFGLVVFECSAQNQFDGRTSEDEGDLRGLLLCCTKAAVQPVGYGNGARRPDGSRL